MGGYKVGPITAPQRKVPIFDLAQGPLSDKYFVVHSLSLKSNLFLTKEGVAAKHIQRVCINGSGTQ